MLTIRFDPSDLARVRVSVSPLTELWQSVRALQSPLARAPWLVEARARVRDLDFAKLRTLHPCRGYSPDFVHPPPDGPFGEFGDELARMVRTPADRIRREIMWCHRDTGVPPALREFVESPQAAVHELADRLRAYWDRVLAPHWERIRIGLQGDVLYRAQRTVGGGIEALFTDLDHSIRYDDARLIIDTGWSGSLDLCGRGLLLIPSIFVWPAVATIHRAPWQPTLIYPARGSGLVWEPLAPPGQTLSALIGARRASILSLLETPCSTTSLAGRLGVGAGSVSQHLAVLHGAGLIERHRVGRVVLYRRSAAGNLLFDANAHSGGRMLPREIPVLGIHQSQRVGRIASEVLGH